MSTFLNGNHLFRSIRLRVAHNALPTRTIGVLDSTNRLRDPRNRALLERVMASSYSYRLLQIALVGFGAVMILLYPLAAVWPSGWAWHPGAPYQSDYFMMIVGVYATLGLFLWNAARRPETNISLIWFTVCSSVVHAAIMAVQSFGSGHHMGHLWGDVPALLLVAIVLSVLVLKSGLKQPRADLAARQVAGGRT
jgi:hypothetical protein